ncbi:MAG: DUF2029 domain-containing protein [Planctomycetes bacterium]|nr:DUF2029 domain-containing protein [Planctomycetota bacterium]
MTLTPPESQAEPQPQQLQAARPARLVRAISFAKARPYVVIAAVVAVVLLVRLSATMWMVLHENEKQDYDRWYKAGQLVLQGKDTTYGKFPDQEGYDFNKYDALKFFRLPPAFAVYVAPLAKLPFWAYALCWFALSGGAAVLSVLLAMKMIHGRFLPQNPVAMILPVAGIAAFAWADMHCGNTNLIQLGLIMLGTYIAWRAANSLSGTPDLSWHGRPVRVFQGRPAPGMPEKITDATTGMVVEHTGKMPVPLLQRAANRAGDAACGLAIGLSIAIKAYPAAILPSLFASFRWRLMVYAVVGAAIWTFVVPGFVRGFERNWNETLVWYGRIVEPYLGSASASRPEEWGGRSYSHKNQSLYPLVKRLTMPVDVTDRHKSASSEPAVTVNVVNWSSKIATMAFAGLVLLMLTAILFVCRDRRPAPNRMDIILDMAIGMNFMLLVSPIAWYYFFSLLLLPMAVGAWRLVVTDSKRERIILIIVWALSFALFLASSVSFWARVYGGTVMLALLWFVVMLIYRHRCRGWNSAS